MWVDLIQRCTNPHAKEWDRYGGRGIKVDSRWARSFEAFLQDVGPRPDDNHSIERIDVNGPYTKSNVRWATNKEQNRNMRNNIWIEYRGMKRILRDWALFFDKSDSPVYNTSRDENRQLEEVALEYIGRWERRKFEYIEQHIHGFDRDADRIKSSGEVFTPGELVNEILEKLPKELFTDPKKTFLDPACGSGQFLVYVVYWKIFYGSTPTEALKTTYGVDIMEDNVRHCRERLLAIADDFDDEIFGIAAARKKYGKIVDHNIVCANALTDWDFENWKRKTKPADDLLSF